MKISVVVEDDCGCMDSVEVDRNASDWLDRIVQQISFHCRRCDRELLHLFMSKDVDLCNNCFVDTLSLAPGGEDR